jgi:hypothetical protein
MKRPCSQAFDRSASSRTRKISTQTTAEIAFACMITTPRPGQCALGDSAHPMIICAQTYTRNREQSR